MIFMGIKYSSPMKNERTKVFCYSLLLTPFFKQGKTIYYTNYIRIERLDKNTKKIAPQSY